jgi:hypothetical protein
MNGGGGSGGESSHCGAMTCGVGEACVAFRVQGGALLLPDANGNCATGQHVEPSGTAGHCARDFQYQCLHPAGCSLDNLSCACGAATCPSGYPSCHDPYAATWLDDSAALVCELLAP